MSTPQTNSPLITDADDPRLSFVDVSQLNVLEFDDLLSVNWADPLITVAGGPLLVAGETGGRQVAIMPFDLRESDFPLHISWPILMSNMMQWFAPQSLIHVEDSIAAGESLVISPPVEINQVKVIPPQGEPTTLNREQGIMVFADTYESGIYTVELYDGDTVVGQQPFAVNLFSEIESNIRPVPLQELTIQGTTIAVEQEEELGQREYWPIAAALALLVLMIEWYIYHQRVRVPKLSASGNRA